jgi:hypothetical protein
MNTQGSLGVSEVYETKPVSWEAGLLKLKEQLLPWATEPEQFQSAN